MNRDLSKKRFTQPHFSIWKNGAGFTLIELLIVIAIIGILSSIIMVNLNTARMKGRDIRRVTDLKQIQEALELYFDSSVGNDGSGANTGASYPTNAYGANILAPTYIPVMPRDPTTLANYKYVALTSGSSITACSAAGPCLYYHLAGDLEQDGTGSDGTGGNATLASDRDLDSHLVSGGFYGISASCTGSSSTNDGCFDLSP